ncbi:MAG: hypothetical protein K8L97_08030 [Anaerolineae bacterium]|nr:hypothetical protein [Anaerolineae bacterium]
MIRLLNPFRLCLFGVVSLLVILSVPSLLDAQTIPGSMIYTLRESADMVELYALTLDGNQIKLFSESRYANAALASVVMKEDVEAITQFLEGRGETAAYISLFLNAPTQLQVEAISVAPDNTQVAINARYQTCTHYPRYVCFGASKIIVIDAATQQQKMVFSLGFNDTQYLPESTPETVFEVRIDKVEWTPDQQNLIVSISDDSIRRNLVDKPILVIPLTNPTPAFRLGAAQTWTIAPNSREIAGISQNGMKNTLNIITFDAATQQVSQANYSLGTYFVYSLAGFAYSGESLVFRVAYDTALLEGGGGIALFNAAESKQINLSPSIAGFSKQIRSTPDGRFTIVETEDGDLWKLTIQNNAVQGELFFQGAVSIWDLRSDGAVLVQLQAGDYQIVDTNGAIIRELNLFDPFSTDQIIGIGW